MSDLTPKQRLFVAEYLIDRNAARAAAAAGYSERTARAIGAENLTKPNIAAAIQARSQALTDEAEATQERTLRELVRLAFSDLRDVVSWDAEGNLTFKPSDELSEDAARAISKITRTRRHFKDGEYEDRLTIELQPKLKALELIAKHNGLLPTPALLKQENNDHRQVHVHYHAPQLDEEE